MTYYEEENNLPCYTRKDIIRLNKELKAQDTALVPLGEKVYDLKTMYTELCAAVQQMVSDTQQELKEDDCNKELPKRLSKSETLLKEIQSKKSKYLHVIGLCKYFGLPKERYEKAKKVSLKGHLQAEHCIEDESSHFRNEALSVLQSIQDDNEANGLTKRSSALQCLKEALHYVVNHEAADSFTFADKMFRNTVHVANEDEFPLPVWVDKWDVRRELHPKWRYQQRMKERKQRKKQLSPEVQEQYIRQNINKTRETLLEMISKLKQESVNQYSRTSLYTSHDYHIHYCETFLQSCQSYARRESDKIFALQMNGFNNTTTAEYNDFSSTVINKSSLMLNSCDINAMDFPLPAYSQNKQMRVYLKDYEGMDCSLDVTDEGKVLPAWGEMIQTHLFTNQTTEEEVHNFFVELVKNKSEPFQTEIDPEKSCIENEFELNVIRNDTVTEEQEELIKSRENRKNFHSKTRRRKRREKLLKYFRDEYKRDYTEFENWAAIFEKSVQNFQDLCNGKAFSEKREVPLTKEELAEQRYKSIMNSVPELTPSNKHKMTLKRNKLMMYFTQSYAVSEPDILLYRDWANRLEEHYQMLQDICQADQQTSATDKTVNTAAIFTSESVFST